MGIRILPVKYNQKEKKISQIVLVEPKEYRYLQCIVEILRNELLGAQGIPCSHVIGPDIDSLS